MKLEKKNVIRNVSLNFLVVISIWTSSAIAATVAWDVQFGTPSYVPSNSLNYGWEFATSATIQVTHLGLFDGPPAFRQPNGGDGLSKPFEVGLWTAEGALLAKTTVEGFGDAQVSTGVGRYQWVFKDIPDVTLIPGNYVVSALLTSGRGDGFLSINSRDITRPPSSLIAPELTLIGNSFHNSESFEFPARYRDPPIVTEAISASANFLFATVPLPPSAILFFSGLIGLGAWRAYSPKCRK